MCYAQTNSFFLTLPEPSFATTFAEKATAVDRKATAGEGMVSVILTFSINIIFCMWVKLAVGAYYVFYFQV